MVNFLKDQDLFGHPVQLNFNKRGPEHTTTLGGIASICVKALMLCYVAILIKRLVKFEDDTIISSSSVFNFDY